MYSSLIKQGDSLIWLVRAGSLNAGDTMTGYEVRAGIYALDGTEIIAPTLFPTTYTYQSEEYILVEFPRSQTAALGEGTYRLVVDCRNDAVTPGYSDESEIVLQVDGQLVA